MPPEHGYRRRESCRSCGAGPLRTVLDYGPMPLAGAFPRPEEVAAERRFPLTLAFCDSCGLVQVPEVVEADVLFRDYRYLASVPLSRHFAAYADSVPDRLGLRPDGLIVEAGCNDGVLLRPLRERGFSRLLGVDPADNVTRHVPEDIPVLSAYLEPDVARRIVAERGPAQLVAANNVFAHMDDPNRFAEAVALLLEPEGSFVFEVHYLVDLIDGHQYDTVYHEHLCYYSLTALRPLLARHGLRLFDVERIANHGGSVRVYACPQAAHRGPSDALRETLAEEERRELGEPAAMRELAAGVEERIARLDGLLERHARSGGRIAAYGAAGRATILFNAVAAARRHVAYVVDESPERIGRVLPGAHVPIVGPDRLCEDPPDLLLVSAWSYADAILAKVRERLGDRSPAACLPLPEPRVIEPALTPA